MVPGKTRATTPSTSMCCSFSAIIFLFLLCETPWPVLPGRRRKERGRFDPDLAPEKSNQSITVATELTTATATATTTVLTVARPSAGAFFAWACDVDRERATIQRKT